MNMKQWKYRMSVCAVVCLMFLCGTMTKAAEDAMPMQDVWADGTEMQTECAEVSATDDMKRTGSAEVSATDDEVLVKSAKMDAMDDGIHIEMQSDAVYLPTGKIVRGFGWQEGEGIWRYHSGADIACANGEGVRAVVSGRLYRVERVAGGYVVEVAGGGDIWRYEPLVSVGMAVGEHITAGAVLGHIGEGGVLHIGRQRDGEWIDPISI